MNNKKLIAAQMATADKVLKQLNTDEFEAVCVGGAPRDWWMGKPANDIDICVVRKPVKFDPGNMVAIPWLEAYDAVGEYATTCGFEVSFSAPEDRVPKGYESNPNLDGVYDLTVDGHKVQLLVVSTSVAAYVANFPYSVCKITYAERCLRPSKEFELSVDMQVVVATGDLYVNGKCSGGYAERITAYFPHYKFYPDWQTALDRARPREVYVDNRLVRLVKRWYNALCEFTNCQIGG